MSLARTLVAKSRSTIPILVPRRRYSEGQDHDGETELVEYPQEGFSSTFWRNSVILSLAAVGFWKLAPDRDEHFYLTRWIRKYGTPAEEWARVNLKHLLMSQEEREGIALISDARLPPVYRYRYPERFEQYSAHRVPVGTHVDMSDLVVKAAKQQD